MCCNIKYVKKYITVKMIKIDLINFERNFICPSVSIKSKQSHATFGHSWNHNKDLAILCFYRYFSYTVLDIPRIILLSLLHLIIHTGIVKFNKCQIFPFLTLILSSNFRRRKKCAINETIHKYVFEPAPLFFQKKNWKFTPPLLFKPLL